MIRTMVEFVAEKPPTWEQRFAWPSPMPWCIAVQNGAEIPPGYGIAFYIAGADVAVCYPMPFNLFASWWRAVVCAVRFPRTRLIEAKLFRINEARANAWELGFESGLATWRVVRGSGYPVPTNPFRGDE